MSSCVFDNPATMCREAYTDGRLIAHLSLAVMETKGFTGHRSIPFYLNIGRWKTGRVVGDRAALSGRGSE